MSLYWPNAKLAVEVVERPAYSKSDKYPADTLVILVGTDQAADDELADEILELVSRREDDFLYARMLDETEPDSEKDEVEPVASAEEKPDAKPESDPKPEVPETVLRAEEKLVERLAIHEDEQSEEDIDDELAEYLSYLGMQGALSACADRDACEGRHRRDAPHIKIVLHSCDHVTLGY